VNASAALVETSDDADPVGRPPGSPVDGWCGAIAGPRPPRSRVDADDAEGRPRHSGGGPGPSGRNPEVVAGGRRPASTGDVRPEEPHAGSDGRVPGVVDRGIRPRSRRGRLNVPRDDADRTRPEHVAAAAHAGVSAPTRRTTPGSTSEVVSRGPGARTHAAPGREPTSVAGGTVVGPHRASTGRRSAATGSEPDRAAGRPGEGPRRAAQGPPVGCGGSRPTPSDVTDGTPRRSPRRPRALVPVVAAPVVHSTGAGRPSTPSRTTRPSGERDRRDDGTVRRPDRPRVRSRALAPNERPRGG
jgi:hypothetical protein